MSRIYSLFKCHVWQFHEKICSSIYCNAVFNLFSNGFFFFPELVIIQSILLALLVVLSVVWAFCCKKRCVGVSSKNNFFFRNSLEFIIDICMYISRKPFKFSDVASVSVDIIILHQIIINIIGQLKCQMAMSAKSQFLIEKCPF